MRADRRVSVSDTYKTGKTDVRGEGGGGEEEDTSENRGLLAGDGTQ